jgi:phenol hydroxylase P4 protein
MAMSTSTTTRAPEARDRLENFHGNQLVYVHWEEHLAFCSAVAFPLPPAMPMGALLSEVLPGVYGIHPDWGKIDWTAVRWTLDNKDFSPRLDVSLADNGIGHKSLLRFWTPGLTGYRASGS